jgi:hypothetical protein
MYPTAVEQQVAELSDDKALLLHWINTLIEAGIPTKYPSMAELVAFTLHQLILEIPRGPLRDNLDDILEHMKVQIRELHALTALH